MAFGGGWGICFHRHDYCAGECMAFDGKVKSYEVKSGKLESYKRKGSGYTLRSNCRVFDLISKAGMKFFLKSFHLFF